MAKQNNFFEIFEKQDKKAATAISIAIFGMLLFIAFALTIPWGL